MNLLLDAASWFSANWPLILIIVLFVAMLVPTYLRQKKDSKARNELQEKIVKGTKIITTAGVYGVVESMEETTDGKVVTIVTGNKKNPTTMQIHINAIMGIDNKTLVVENAATDSKEETKEVEKESEEKEDVTEEIEKKVTNKSSKSKKK